MEKYQILLVDDHKILLEGTQRLLSGLDDYEVASTASSGKVAIELLKSRDFDILVTDFEIVRRLSSSIFIFSNFIYYQGNRSITSDITSRTKAVHCNIKCNHQPDHFFTESKHGL